MNQIEEALTGLISKDPAIVNENANKDSDTFYYQSTLQMHIKEGTYIFTT